MNNYSDHIQKFVEQMYMSFPLIKSIIDAFHSHGATILLVGGAVRDIVRDVPTKDLDFEIYNLSLEACETILRQFGPMHIVGK